MMYKYRVVSLIVSYKEEKNREAQGLSFEYPAAKQEEIAVWKDIETSHQLQAGDKIMEESLGRGDRPGFEMFGISEVIYDPGDDKMHLGTTCYIGTKKQIDQRIDHLASFGWQSCEIGDKSIPQPVEGMCMLLLNRARRGSAHDLSGFPGCHIEKDA